MVCEQVVITGASSGIGAAFARRLAGECKLMVLVARRADVLETLAAELRRQHPHMEVATAPCDLADESQRKVLMEACAGLDSGEILLINNAGLGDHGDFCTSNPARNRDMLQVNVCALTELTHALLPRIVRQGGGIINIASLAAELPIPDFAVYAASKAYVASFSEALRLELQEFGIPVLAVCPGPVHTGFGDVARRAGQGSGDVPFKKWFYTTIDEVVEGSLVSLLKGRARYYPSLKIRLSAWLLRLAPLALLRRIMAYRPRRTSKKTDYS